MMIDALVGNDYSLCLCSGLIAHEVDVELLVPENRVVKQNEDLIIKKWLPSKQQNSSKFFKIFVYIKYLFKILYKSIKKRNVVVHYQFFRVKFEPIFLLLLRMFNVQLVITAHNVLPHEKSRFDNLLQLTAYKASKVIIVHSSYVKSKLLANFNIPEDKIKIIPHGNFDNYLPERLPSIKEARDFFDLKENENVLLFFGYIREYKGLNTLLEALCKIKSKSSKVPRLIVAADAVVLPYEKIDHSGIIHLANTFKKPAIATKVGDFAEVINNGETGILLKENNSHNLAHVITNVFKDKEKLRNMGKAANRANKLKYSWKNIVQLTLRAYNHP